MVLWQPGCAATGGTGREAGWGMGQTPGGRPSVRGTQQAEPRPGAGYGRSSATQVTVSLKTV